VERIGLKHNLFRLDIGMATLQIDKFAIKNDEKAKILTPLHP